MTVDPEQRARTSVRARGRNLKKAEVLEFVKEFVKITKGIKIHGKPFALSGNSKMIGTNPDLTIEEIQKVLDVNDKSKVDFIRQLYIRGGSSILTKLWPDDNIVNLPTISFEQVGEAINLSF